MADDYAARFEPLWLAWKAGSPPSGDADWTERWNKFIHIVEVVTGRSTEPAQDPLAADFLRTQRIPSLNALRATLSLPDDAGTIRLHRGVNDEAAQRIQLARKAGQPPIVLADLPLSYTITDGVAVSFARKGHVHGLVYSVDVPVDDIIFFDHERRWKAEGLVAENEVLVWHRAPISTVDVKAEHEFVPPMKPTAPSLTKSEAWRTRQKELQDRHPELYIGRI